ncbi:MAG TPA: hypothetical protein VFM48_12025 [Aquabacterium sp.]|nr:hypothetical protein [Aquabacterium sp.]
MFPWLWYWAPQLHLPWSGAVEQDIHPNTNWFAQNIKGESGNAEVERVAFAIASYGTQLGLITEVLMATAEKLGPLSGDAAQALDRLREIKKAIDGVKPPMKRTESS